MQRCIFSMQKIFKGTGLGLSLSFDIIKSHGGEIRAASMEGEGTEMTVELMS